MPPDRGRASQACTACRKQKTRCYPSPGRQLGGACLRCQRLEQECSLDSPLSTDRNSDSHIIPDGADLQDRLSRLESIVNTIVKRLDGLIPPLEEEIVVASPVQSRQNESSSQLRLTGSSDAPPIGIASTPSTVTSAPVFVIRDVAREVGATQETQEVTNLFEHQLSIGIIDSGLLNPEDASSLIGLFVEHYGRWVAFKEDSAVGTLPTEIQGSPLLLCACCLIAVRHTNQDYASTLAPQLFKEAKSLLSAALLVSPQSLAFFQAALVMSMWSTTIGQALLSVDSWLISGFAIQHALSSELFSSFTDKLYTANLSREEADRWFIWNHLCLVHLHYCVGTRRKAMISREQIDKCGRILTSEHITNFETRMIAEVNLYWIIYESCSSSNVELPPKQILLNSWRQEWKFLFDQPRPQFIQMGFHFAQLLIYDQALVSRSAAVRESLLSEMVRLSAEILNLAMDTADLRTQHLSDHIYHIITFAAVTLCRLIHMYEDQLSRSHKISELDQLVLNLVTWLHSIGLPCHVSHTLADVVSAFFEKLRPNARPTPTYEEAWAQVDLLNFPDQFGTELFYLGNGHFSPDWDPYVQGPAS